MIIIYKLSPIFFYFFFIYKVCLVMFVHLKEKSKFLEPFEIEKRRIDFGLRN